MLERATAEDQERAAVALTSESEAGRGATSEKQTDGKAPLCVWLARGWVWERKWRNGSYGWSKQLMKQTRPTFLRPDDALLQAFVDELPMNVQVLPFTQLSNKIPKEE